MKRVKTLTMLLAVPLMLVGCVDAIAESRVKSALVDAGLDDANADCMAERMVDRLTIDQLKKLERVKAEAGERETGLSLSDYVKRVRRVGDGEVVAVTASSAALCATGFAPQKR
ncbi:hypothetical protein HME9302_01743 [Alteripontixanthobacter maritimus]|uniref:Lipoprotein n=1 Tax=Alteripontixanthobacter maritimus TaxID=2161824 RepID=A0A369Q7V1_9SPHN|nr:hypothetical protein [Alteripontixanthobacter maritimus]RDC60532.1 hypothetical protein HME9302_01743 [Alteripontixanthobacter maritimus]